MQFTAADISIREESLAGYRVLWRKSRKDLPWSCLCMLPPWIESWWTVFGRRADLHICAFYCGDTPVGVAPLQVDGKIARLIGDADVCDYLDFIVWPGAYRPFFESLFDYLRQSGITALDLRAQRPDSAFMAALAQSSHRLDCETICDIEDQTYELELPSSWDAYLASLRGKDRHEIRRKTRRLCEAGKISTRMAAEVKDVQKVMPVFMELFANNRSDKAAFMTDQMSGYFLRLAKAASKEGFLKLLLVELDNNPAAAVMLFDHNRTRYLYNNGYAQRYHALSVGHLSKVYSIQDGINSGIQRYDFLKGQEPYKKRLGGKAVPICRCQVKI
jgi:CelD/BcsL family acetyltransferase involved in cellulose biosynthesis